VAGCVTAHGVVACVGAWVTAHGLVACCFKNYFNYLFIHLSLI
jgi:hypothetical protein